MTSQLFHSLVVLIPALFAAQGRPLMAQSADGDGGTRAPSSQILESDRDAGAIGRAKTKGYEFRSIDYPGGELSQVYDFNAKTAVGCVDFDAFAFDGSSYVLLNIPGAINSCGYGINTSGKIVGEYNDSTGIH